ncbi:MAG TPA: three-Cys-motif partner protein TcmP [Phycisphaerales bacterium]|nr:three-Cys-motif partner protein TcmP [Phycisphaerales bacterium]
MSEKKHFQELQPQTEIKHRILEDYLLIWAKVLQGNNDKLCYIDGFSGEGVYGENIPGSPLIAIKLAGRILGQYKSKLNCVFIEKNHNRAENLRQRLLERGAKENQEFWIKNVGFDEYVHQVVTKTKRPVPLFFFVDPCGWTGFKMKSLGLVLKKRRTEILINFMYNSVQRFLGVDGWWEDVFGLDAAGVDELRSLVKAGDKEREILDAYCRQLKRHTGAKFVFPFQVGMPGAGRTYFYLIHCSNHYLGHKIMKEVMWSKSDHGFRFSAFDPSHGQLDIFEDSLSPEQVLMEKLLDRFAGRSVQFEKLLEQTSESTLCLEKHYRDLLKHLEKENKIDVQRVTSKTKRGLSGKDVIIFPEGLASEQLQLSLF